MMLDVVAGAGRRLERAAHALHATLAVGDGALRLGPPRGRRQHDVRELGGLGEEDVLHDQVVEAAQQAHGARLVGLGLRAGFSPTM